MVAAGPRRRDGSRLDRHLDGGLLTIRDQQSQFDHQSLTHCTMAATARKIREFQRREEDILDAALELCSQPDWETVSVE